MSTHTAIVLVVLAVAGCALLLLSAWGCMLVVGAHRRRGEPHTSPVPSAKKGAPGAAAAHHGIVPDLAPSISVHFHTSAAAVGSVDGQSEPGNDAPQEAAAKGARE
jgi:hypothetical protein